MVKPTEPNRNFYLRAHRDVAGLTQDELAEACDMTKGQVSQLETGHTRYSEKVVPKLAKALGLKVYQLFLPPETNGSVDEQFEAVKRAWSYIPDQQKTAIAALVVAYLPDDKPDSKRANSGNI